MRLRSFARASLSAATASARCASKSRDSNTAITSPAWTTLFFNSAIFFICALIFAPTSAFSRVQIVPTAEIGSAMFPFSALTTLTLTVGVTSVSASVADLFKRQTTNATSSRTTSALPAIKTMLRWRTMRARLCSLKRRSTSSSGILFVSSLMCLPAWKRSVPPAIAGGSKRIESQNVLSDPPATAGGTDLLPSKPAFSLAGRPAQTRQRRLVIEDRLVQSVALLDQSRLRIRDFNYLRFARAIARDRRGNVVLCFRHAFTREFDARCGIRDLCLCRVELLRESTQRDCSFVLRHFDTQTCLALATTTRTPVEDRNRKTD